MNVGFYDSIHDFCIHGKSTFNIVILVTVAIIAASSTADWSPKCDRVANVIINFARNISRQIRDFNQELLTHQGSRSRHVTDARDFQPCLRLLARRCSTWTSAFQILELDSSPTTSSDGASSRFRFQSSNSLELLRDVGSPFGRHGKYITKEASSVAAETSIDKRTFFPSKIFQR